MKSKIAARMLEETPLEIKIFVKKYSQIVLRIHDLMAQKGWSQRDLAERMDKQPSEVSRWLNGEQNLTLKSIARLEAELGEDIILVERSNGNHTDLPKQSISPQPTSTSSDMAWRPLQATIVHSRKSTECIA